MQRGADTRERLSRFYTNLPVNVLKVAQLLFAVILLFYVQRVAAGKLISGGPGDLERSETFD